MARFVCVYDFETENGYQLDAKKGKPLSAYEFATGYVENNDIPIKKVIKQIVSWTFEKEWNENELEAIVEPWKPE